MPETTESQLNQKFQQPSITSLLGVKEQDLVLPVSVEIARERLRAALATSFTQKPGFLSPKEEYSGQLNGDALQMELTFRHSRGPMMYDVQGQLMAEASGAVLRLTIREQYPWGILFAPCLGYLFAIFFSLGAGLSGLKLLLTVLIAGTIMAGLLGGIAYASTQAWRNTAAARTAEVLWHIVINVPVRDEDRLTS
ncbi:MAG: hypothetical protein ACKVZH_11885 [Blastocatellia bacterium]